MNTTLNTTTKSITAPTYTSVDSIQCELDYRQAVLSLVDSVVTGINEALESEQVEFNQSDIEDFVNDTLLHETVDGSEFAIYNHYHLPIIMHSSNDEAYQDVYGLQDAGALLANHGLSGLHAAISFWAMYYDVQEELNTILNETDYDVEDEDED